MPPASTAMSASVRAASAGHGGDHLSSDPDRGQPYGFRVLDDTSYQLCATFDRDSKEDQRSYGREFWAHAAGTHCFTQKVPPKQP